MFILSDVQRCILIEAFISGFDTVHPHGFVFNGEMHDFWEVVFVSDGAAVATADERVYNLTKGKLLFHKPMEFHRIRSADGSAPHVHIISFVAKGDIMKQFENRCFDLDKTQSEDFVTLCKKIGLAVKSRQDGEKQSVQTLKLNTAAVFLEKFLLELTENKTLIYEELSENEIIFKRIIDIMQKHSSENLSVPEIARLSRMSVSNMKRIFSMYSDKGIAKHFLILKLRRASELLNDGYSAAYIAEALNFSSTNYFHTAFKREFGTTPAKYRKTKERTTEMYTAPH